MIAEDIQSLSIVENKGFKKLINLLDSRYTLPSRRTIGRTILPDLYESTRVMVQYCLLSMFVRFLNLKTFVLTTRKLTFSNTAQYLSEVLTNIIKEWEIETKVVAIVSDSGANIKAAIRLLEINHIPCVAHKLNNAVKTALKI